MSATITPASIPSGSWSIISAGTGAMDVAAIPSGFKFLRLSVLTASGLSITLRFNNDSGNNYNSTFDGSSGTVHSEAQNTMTLFSEGAGYTVLLVATIANIATANKHVSGVFHGYAGGATQDDQCSAGGTWINSTDEINRVALAGNTPTYWALEGMVLP